MKTIIESALKFAQEKRSFFSTVAALPPDERWRVIAELSVVADEPALQCVPVEPTQPEPPRAKRHYKKRAISLHAETNHTAILVRMLKTAPHTPLPALADKVYGGHDKGNLGKTRSLLSALGSRNIVKRVGTGVWEVGPESAVYH